MAKTYTNIGSVYAQQGKLPQAAETYRKAVAIKQKALGAENWGDLAQPRGRRICRCHASKKKRSVVDGSRDPMVLTSERRQIELTSHSDDLVRGLSTRARTRVPPLMMAIDCRVDREARPVRYLSRPVLPNQARLEFDSVSDRLDVNLFRIARPGLFLKRNPG